MADYVDTKVSNLVINNLTQEKYDELLASGQINPDELYCTPARELTSVATDDTITGDGTPDNPLSVADALVSKANLAIFDAIYPVGSIYIGTQSTCPMAVAIPGSTWQLVSAGRALWTGNGSNGNTTIAAGLPNITGTWNANGLKLPNETSASDAFSKPSTNRAYGNQATTGTGAAGISFSAKDSNSIYGNSTTVQPPAYVVNVWRRTA